MMVSAVAVFFLLAKPKITMKLLQPDIKLQMSPSSQVLGLSWPGSQVDWREDLSVILTSVTSHSNLPTPPFQRTLAH